MYPRQPISYPPFPQQTVYYTQPVYQYHNYPGKINQIPFTPEPTPIMAAPSNPPPMPTQIPAQHENMYINYQQPQQPILHPQQLPQQQIPPQHIHPQQIQQQQQQRQYEISHQISQIQQVPIGKQRSITDPYIGQQIKIKNKPIYPTQIPPTQLAPTQVSTKQIIQPPPQRPQMQSLMIAQPHPIPPPPPRQYAQLPPKQLQIINQPETKPIEQYKPRQEENNITSSNHKLSFILQDNEPPGCFDIIGRGNLPSIYFNSEISFS